MAYYEWFPIEFSIFQTLCWSDFTHFLICQRKMCDLMWIRLILAFDWKYSKPFCHINLSNVWIVRIHKIIDVEYTFMLRTENRFCSISSIIWYPFYSFRIHWHTQRKNYLSVQYKPPKRFINCQNTYSKIRTQFRQHN